jgi:N-acetylglucosamine malate deacetylase 2
MPDTRRWEKPLISRYLSNSARIQQSLQKQTPAGRASKFLTDTQLPGWLISQPVAIVVAHPDDEVLGLGTLLPHLKNVRAIVHVTDGAPRRGPDVANAGVSSWQEYAALRRRELQAAMQAAGVHGARLICLECPDQEASFRIPQLSRRLARLFRQVHTRVVFTHPYEGGHPDHDACAAAVRLACLLMPCGRVPQILEFTSYHMAPDGALEAERFLTSVAAGKRQRTMVRPPAVWRRVLNDTQRQTKRDLVSCYPSQRAVLSQFPTCQEPIRMAPDYDFTKPPHRGKLYYENFNWGMTAPRWRRLARRAMSASALQRKQ